MFLDEFIYLLLCFSFGLSSSHSCFLVCLIFKFNELLIEFCILKFRVFNGKIMLANDVLHGVSFLSTEIFERFEFKIKGFQLSCFCDKLMIYFSDCVLTFLSNLISTHSFLLNKLVPYYLSFSQSFF